MATTAYDYGVRISADAVTKDARAGDLVAFTLELLNNGAYVDDFDLELSGNTWTTTLTSTVVTLLQPGESAFRQLTVQVPAGAVMGALDTVSVTAASQNAPARTDMLILTTRLPLYQLFLPGIEK